MECETKYDRQSGGTATDGRLVHPVSATDENGRRSME